MTISKWVNQVVAEVIYADGEQIGSMLEVNFKKGKWTTRMFATDLKEDAGDLIGVNKVVKSYYGTGDNYYFTTQRDFGRDDKFRGRLILRDGDADRMIRFDLYRRFGGGR